MDRLPVYRHLLRHQLDDTAGQRLAVRRVTHVELEQGELVAAQPGEDIAAAQYRAEAFGGDAQHRVPGGMAEQIVHRLEAVEVDHQHGEGLVPLAARGDLQRQQVMEAAAIDQSRKGVVIGQALQARFGAQAIPLVAHRQHDLPLRSEQHFAVHNAHRHQRSVGGDQLGFLLLALEQMREIDLRQQQVQRRAFQFRGIHAAHPGEARIHGEDRPAVRDQQSLERHGSQRLHPLLVAPQLCRGLQREPQSDECHHEQPQADARHDGRHHGRGQRVGGQGHARIEHQAGRCHAGEMQHGDRQDQHRRRQPPAGPRPQARHRHGQAAQQDAGRDREADQAHIPVDPAGDEVAHLPQIMQRGDAHADDHAGAEPPDAAAALDQQEHARGDAQHAGEQRRRRQHRVERRLHAGPERQQADHVGRPGGASGRQDADSTPGAAGQAAGPYGMYRQREGGVYSGYAHDGRQQQQAAFVRQCDAGEYRIDRPPPFRCRLPVYTLNPNSM